VLLHDRSYVIASQEWKLSLGAAHRRLLFTTDREVVGEVIRFMGLSKQSFSQSEMGENRRQPEDGRPEYSNRDLRDHFVSLRIIK
jgi:hypothetical protein